MWNRSCIVDTRRPFACIGALAVGCLGARQGGDARADAEDGDGADLGGVRHVRQIASTKLFGFKLFGRGTRARCGYMRAREQLKPAKQKNVEIRPKRHVPCGRGRRGIAGWCRGWHGAEHPLQLLLGASQLLGRGLGTLRIRLHRRDVRIGGGLKRANPKSDTANAESVRQSARGIEQRDGDHAADIAVMAADIAVMALVAASEANGGKCGST